MARRKRRKPGGTDDGVVSTSSGASVGVTARFRRRDGTEIEHACSFTSDEWERLERFVRSARELYDTGLLKTHEPLKFSISADANGVRFEGTSLPDPDLFRSLLMRMRPFVLESEDTNFKRVVNILLKQLDHPVFRTYLLRQKAIFDGQRCQLFNFVSDGTLVNSPKILTLWLNAYEYHHDEKKRAEFVRLHSGMQPLIEHSEAMFKAMVLDQARAVLDVGNAIFAIRANAAVAPLPGDIPLDEA